MNNRQGVLANRQPRPLFCLLFTLIVLICGESTRASALVIQCPAGAPWVLPGDTVRWTVTASGGNEGARRFFMATPGPDQPVIDSVTGAVTYIARWDDAFLGTARCETVGVTDGVDSSLCSVCWMTGDGPGTRILLESKNYVTVGSTIDIRIFMISMLGSEGFGGFDFLIAPGSPALSFLSASPGEMYDSCGWEYFTYRFGEYDTCATCPRGMIHITGLAETNPVSPHPTCGLQWQDIPLPITLATLKVRLSLDYQQECALLPVRFFWTDCSDNTVWSRPSSHRDIAMAHRIYDPGNPVNLADPNAGMPGFAGPTYACDYYTDTTWRFRDMELKNSGIEVSCLDPISRFGDINMNNFPYEIADAVLFIDYFTKGLAVFGSHISASMAASDVNNDGAVLTLPDLIYLIRVILGDAPPIPKLVASQVATITTDNGTISVKDSPDLGAVLFRLKGDVVISSLRPELYTSAHFDGRNTNVLITIPFNRPYSGTGFSGDLISAGDAEIENVELVDFDGRLVSMKLNIRDRFVFEPIYPNPFNPSTTFRFSLPMESDYDLSIYNMLGQRAMNFNGHVLANQPISLAVNMFGKSSGVYLFRFQGAGITYTQKALFLK